jgi:anti-sigma factor RsiW
MAQIINLHGNPHDQVQELLPWFVNGTLDSSETERVEAHLAACAECRAELAGEQHLARAVATLPQSADSGWENMQQRLDAEPEYHRREASSFWRKRVPVGWAVATPLAAAAAFALAFVDVTPRQPLDPQYRALGAAPVAQSANVVVQFEPGARVRDMQAALAAVDAHFVDGPTDTGAYMLRVDDSKRELALKRLRDDDVIALAEPIGGAANP